MVNIETTDPEQEEIGDAAPLVASIRGAHEPGRRRIVGAVGAPGAGKTRLAQFLQHAVPDAGVAIVPMDGFPLANEVSRPPARANTRADRTRSTSPV